MRRPLIALAAALSVLASAAHAKDGPLPRPPTCGDPMLLKQKGVRVTTRPVKLQPKPAEPAFYLLAGEAAWGQPHFAILLPAAALVEETRRQNASTSAHGPSAVLDRMLLALQADLPLPRYMDLQQYDVPDGAMHGAPVLMASWLLGRGEASVIDLWAGNATALPEVLVSDIRLAGSRFIAVCDTSGAPLLSLTQSIAD